MMENEEVAFDRSQDILKVESVSVGIAKAKKALKLAFAHDRTLEDAVREQMENEDWEGVAATLMTRYKRATSGEGSLAEMQAQSENESWFENPRDVIVGFDNAFGTGMNLSDWFESQEWGSFVSPIGKPGQREVKDVNIVHITVRGNGTKGGVVYVPGSGEPIRKMDEYAATLLRLGYSPIYIYAHRGQGESDRLISNRNRLYIEGPRDFAHDLRAYTEIVAEQRAASEEDKERPLFMVCHSLGGGVATAYMIEEYEAQRSSRYAAVALVAPFVKADSGSFPYFAAQALANILHALGLGQTDRPFGGSVTFEETYAVEAFAENKLTHSFTRYSYDRSKCNRYRETLLGADLHPGLCLFGQTVSWVKVLFDMYDDTAQMFMSSEGKELDVPILLQTAGPPEGTDEYVQNGVASAFCKHSAVTCTHSSFPDGKHGLLLETDEIRERLFAEIDEFFVANSGFSSPVDVTIPANMKENGEGCKSDIDCFSRNCHAHVVFHILGSTCEPQGTFLADGPTPEPLRSPGVALAATAVLAAVLFWACLCSRLNGKAVPG